MAYDWTSIPASNFATAATTAATAADAATALGPTGSMEVSQCLADDNDDAANEVISWMIEMHLSMWFCQKVEQVVAQIHHLCLNEDNQSTVVLMNVCWC